MPFAAGLALALSTTLSGSAATVQSAAPAAMPAAQTVQEYVEGYFADTPVMINIARCESRYRQFDKNGDILKNPHSSAIGVFQIMSSLHTKTAADLGFDIRTIEGNSAYARYLYDKLGTQPWNASSSCWSSNSNLAKK